MKQYFLNLLSVLLIGIPFVFAVQLSGESVEEKKTESLAQSSVRILFLQVFFIILLFSYVRAPGGYNFRSLETIPFVILWGTMILITVFLLIGVVHPLFPLVRSTRSISLFMILISAVDLKFFSDFSFLHIFSASILLSLISYLVLISLDYKMEKEIISMEYELKKKCITRETEKEKERYLKNYPDLITEKLNCQQEKDFNSAKYQELQRKSMAYEKFLSDIENEQEESLRVLEETECEEYSKLLQCYNKNIFYKFSSMIISLLRERK